MKKINLIWKRLTAVTVSLLFATALSSAVSATVDGSVVSLNGTASKNLSAHNYSMYDKAENSHIIENTDGSWTRVEYIANVGVLVECYDQNGSVQQSQVIECELPIYGGFYSGENYYFLVYGQENLEETDAAEVIRVVKYSKDWERLDACSIYGENTQIPFRAGSMRMTETDGMLYIYTCHQMYVDPNGTNHQSNMTLLVQQETMDITVSPTNYISHSFSQYIQTDGAYVYRVDHGDAYPRSVTLNRSSLDTVAESTMIDVIEIQGTYDVEGNDTGVSVGGLALSEENCLITGNSVDQSDSDTYDPAGKRNIFLTVTDKSLEHTDLIWLTNYTSSDNVTTRTPQIVQYDDDSFLILWEEYTSSSTDVKMVTVDGNGTLTSQVVGVDYRLSDCQPIVTSDGMAAWYTSDGKAVQLYRVDPTRLYQYNILCGENVRWTFDEETGIFTVSGSGEMYDYEDGMQPWAKYMSEIKIVEFDERVTKIGANAFAGADLEYVGIRDTVTEVGEHAIGYVYDADTGGYTVDEDFVLCGDSDSAAARYAEQNGIQFAQVDGTCGEHIIWHLDKEIGTLYLWGYGEMYERKVRDEVDPNYWLGYQDIIQKVVISDGVTTLGDRVFYGFSCLKEVTLPDSLIQIGSYAFGNCTALTDIVFPAGLIKFNNSAFQNCTALTEISLPPLLTMLDYSVFRGCTNLTTIMISKSVTSIEKLAFDGCTALTDVYYEGTEQEWNQITFGDLSLLKVTLHFAGEDIEQTDTTTTQTETISTTTETTTTETVNTTDAVGTRLCGDVTCDGIVNMADVVFLSKYAVKVVDLSDTAYRCADCDANDDVNGVDAYILLQYATQVIDILPYIG